MRWNAGVYWLRRSSGSDDRAQHSSGSCDAHAGMPSWNQPRYVNHVLLYLTASCLQIPKIYTHWASIILFFYFGLTSLKEVLFAPKVC